MEIPDPEYVKTEDGAYIAYQVVGDGPVDVVWQLDGGGSLDVWWEDAWERAWREGLASFARLILHDWRGTGLSSRNVAMPNLETRALDLLAVLDAVGSTSAVMGAYFESLAPCLLLAASRPERVRALIWWSPMPRTTWAPDYPWGWAPEAVALERQALEHWGTIEYGRLWAAGFEDNNGFPIPDEAVRWQAKLSRSTCTPDVAVELAEIWWQTDIRGVLPAVQTPTLLLVGEGEGHHPAAAEYVASLMPNAQVEVFPKSGWPTSREDIERDTRPKLAAVRRFIGIEPAPAPLDTILSTVLFTDIVDSTEHQARLGDRGWKHLVEGHHATVRETLDHWRGVENDTAGDGFYATFDGPARAVRCALEIRERVTGLGIQIRAGVHTGECEVIDGKIGGIAVTIGARISSLAQPSQVLVSQTVKDLVAGSGFTFTAAGEHALKGIPDRWRIYAAT
jgi:class 3 adenylate cyclase